MRKWSEPVFVDDHMERVVHYADGTVSRDVNITFTEEQWQEIVQGYRCIRCLKHVETAFPVSCGFPYCDGYPDGFPMKERQRKVIEDEFDGEEWIGVSRETYERDMNLLDKKLHPTKPRDSRIWVPGKD